MACAVFGDVGGQPLLRALHVMFHNVTQINHESFCVAGAIFGDVGESPLLCFICVADQS